MREKSGSVPCEEIITATYLAYQALLQQNPVQYARRRVCGKIPFDFVCLVSRQISIPAFCNRHVQQRRQCCSNWSKHILFSVRGFSGGKNADKSRPTAFARSRYALQNPHLFPCDSQANRMPNVLGFFLKRIQQRPRIHPVRKVVVATATGEMWIVSVRGVLRRPDPVCDDLHSICGKNRQPVRVSDSLLPCKLTDPFPFLFPNLHGQIPAFSRAHTIRISSSVTPKSCAVCSSANLRENRDRFRVKKQNPVQYARRRICGKNRDRFHLKKPICLSILQQLRQKCPVFRAWFQQRKRSGTLPCKFCVPGKPVNPNFLRKTCAAKAARIHQLREKSAIFPCVVSVATCFL